MTTEHKILTLIDRGVRSESDIAPLFDGAAHEISMALYSCTIAEDVGLWLSLTDRGVDRLNELDDAREDSAT